MSDQIKTADDLAQEVAAVKSEAVKAWDDIVATAKAKAEDFKAKAEAAVIPADAEFHSMFADLWGWLHGLVSHPAAGPPPATPSANQPQA